MKTRTHYALINSSVSTISQFFKVILQFVNRSIFIYFLGSTYLGLNGLFTNVLSILSLAELGIGTSINYALYKPIAKGDHEKIKQYMLLYKKVYHVIGLVVGLLGLCIIPILPVILGNDAKEVPYNQILIIYLLFLANSVISYFFTYKRSLLIADQHGYITIVYDLILFVMCSVGQFISLKLTGSYILFLILQILTTYLSNLLISHKVNKTYQFLQIPAQGRLGKEEVIDLKKNTIGNLSSKIGTIIVLGTDNILISAFVSLSAVGIYSNYVLLTAGVRSLTKQLTNSFTSTIGNLIQTSTKENVYQFFKKHLFMNFTLVYFCTNILWFVLNPFIKIWLGNDYLFSSTIFMFFMINFSIQMYRSSSLAFIDSFGLFWIQRWKSIVESGFNLFFSLIFLAVFKLGISGVLLGTIISSLLTVCWYEPYIVYRYGFNQSFKQYLIMTIKYFFVLILSLLVNHLLDPFVPVNNIVFLIIKCFVIGIVSLVIYLIFFINTEEFKYFWNLVLRMVKRNNS